jgi:hypothetical protein
MPPAPHHEERQHEDRDRREDRVDDAEADVAQHAGRVAEPLGELLRLLLQLAGEVVVLLELAQLVVVVDEVRELLRVFRQVVDEVVGLRHDRRHEQADERERSEDQRDVDDRDRQPALHPPLEERDRARQRDRDEPGDEDPRERLAQDVDQHQREDDGDDDEHRPQDRADPREIWLAGTDGGHAPRPEGSPRDPDRLPVRLPWWTCTRARKSYTRATPRGGPC